MSLWGNGNTITGYSSEELSYWVEDALGRLNDLHTAIRVYRGADLIREERFEAR